jgi:hypothetical protein
VVGEAIQINRIGGVKLYPAVLPLNVTSQKLPPRSPHQNGIPKRELCCIAGVPGDSKLPAGQRQQAPIHECLRSDKSHEHPPTSGPIRHQSADGQCERDGMDGRNGEGGSPGFSILTAGLGGPPGALLP